MYYGSARGRSDKLIGPSLWIPLCNSATSIYAACTIFLFLGHVSFITGKEIKDIAKSGPTLLFVAFPSILNFFPAANFFAVVFFIMCLFLGIDSVFAFMDYYIKMARDTMPGLMSRYKHWQQVAILMIFSFIWSLMFVMEGGIHNFNNFDNYCSSIQLLACLFLQTIFIPFLFGIDKLSELVFIRTQQRIPKFFVFIIKTFVPVFGFIMLHFSYTGEFSMGTYTARTGYEKIDGKWVIPDTYTGPRMTDGHLWGFRLLIIIPGLIAVVCMFIPLDGLKDIHVLIEEQYGIVFEEEPDVPLWKYLFKNEAAFKKTNPALYDAILDDPSGNGKARSIKTNGIVPFNDEKGQPEN